jgi:hypothetical protein
MASPFSVFVLDDVQYERGELSGVAKAVRVRDDLSRARHRAFGNRPQQLVEIDGRSRCREGATLDGTPLVKGDDRCAGVA